MNILYLNGPFRRLPFSRSSRSPAVPKSGTLYYPIGLAYAAGLARRRTDYQIALVDAVARRWDRDDLVGHLADDPPDLAICDTSTASIDEDLATARAIKRAFPAAKVVLVGTHASALAEPLLGQHPEIDAVAVGEYDQTVIDLADCLDGGGDWSEVAQIAYRRDGQPARTAGRDLLDDLDEFPFVSGVYKEFLRLEDYFFAAARFPMVMIMTSRGCPHRCDWCLYPQVMHGGKYRRRTAANVAAEFAWIAAELPRVREVGLEDDLFTGDRARLREICRLLIGQNNRLGFWCDTRVDLDYETMRLMKAAGCRLLIAGFESARQEVLDRIGKGTRLEQARQFMDDARRAGLLVHGCFVLGNPGETREHLEETVRFAQRLNPDTAQFFPMMVYPGTRMYDWTRQNGYLTTQDPRRWLTADGLHNSVVNLPGLPAEEVVRFCDYARREFYLRRQYVWRKITQSLVSAQEARRNWKAFRRFVRYLLKAS